MELGMPFEGGLFDQFTDVQAMIAAASRCAPRRATVYVFPCGGVTFPVL